MKKKYLIPLVAVIVLAILLVIIQIMSKTVFSKKEVELNYWNNPYARYVVCKATMKETPEISYSECRAAFISNADMEELIDSNRKAYIGEVTYINDCLMYTASLFFHDDNYYVLYYDDYNDMYRVENCYIYYGMSDSIVYVPCPASLYIEESCIQMDIDYGDNTLDYLFDNYSFEEAKTFYERISKEYVNIDTENQQITVDGYDVKQNKLVEECLKLDFKNRIFIGKDKNGNAITITGKE